ALLDVMLFFTAVIICRAAPVVVIALVHRRLLSCLFVHPDIVSENLVDPYRSRAKVAATVRADTAALPDRRAGLGSGVLLELTAQQRVDRQVDEALAVERLPAQDAFEGEPEPFGHRPAWQVVDVGSDLETFEGSAAQHLLVEASFDDGAHD